MPDLLIHPGYITLFITSFLAATVVPFGSEWLLVTMVLQGFEPIPIVATATTGNYLGACTTYMIGVYGGSMLIRKVLRISEPSQQKAQEYFKRYGTWSLLLAWLPVIGDPLCLAGGIFKVPFPLFSILVIIGKLGRYAVVAALTMQGLQAVG